MVFPVADGAAAARLRRARCGAQCAEGRNGAAGVDVRGDGRGPGRERIQVSRLYTVSWFIYNIMVYI